MELNLSRTTVLYGDLPSNFDQIEFEVIPYTDEGGQVVFDRADISYHEMTSWAELKGLAQELVQALKEAFAEHPDVRQIILRCK